MEPHKISKRMKTTSRRNKLNPKQIHTLKLMYKFRFVTAQLLAEYKGIRVSAVNKSLAVLVAMDYVSRRYASDYKIERKGASYFLAPKALIYLRDEHQQNERVLHSMYKNKSVGQPFIDHSIDVFKAYVVLRESYPGTFHMFTKSELGDYDYFPEVRPDLYLNRIKPADSKQNEYVLDIFIGMQPFLIKKRFEVYLEHFESGEWEAEAETSYPIILLVCPDARTERKLQDYIAKTLDNAGIDDLTVYTTTAKTLLTTANTAIWSKANEPEVLLSL